MRRPCAYRVVHVSGTMRKIEEVAIRRSRQLIMAAKQEMAGQGADALTILFGSRGKDQDLVIEDAQDSTHGEEEEDEEESRGWTDG